MSSNLAPYLSQIPIGSVVNQRGDVLASPDLIRWLESLIRRIGGTDALTNIELANALASLAAGDMVVQTATSLPAFADVTQPSQSDAQFADVVQNASNGCLGESTWQI